MNHVVLIGRLTKDVELSSGTTEVARTSIAVQRKFKNADGNYDADFINLVAFGKTAEFISKYFKKGDPIVVEGRIQTGSYTNKDGQKVYTTDIVVESTEFAIGAKSSGSGETPKTADSDSDFMKAETSDDMPF